MQRMNRIHIQKLLRRNNEAATLAVNAAPADIRALFSLISIPMILTLVLDLRISSLILGLALIISVGIILDLRIRN